MVVSRPSKNDLSFSFVKLWWHFLHFGFSKWKGCHDIGFIQLFLIAFWLPLVLYYRVLAKARVAAPWQSVWLVLRPLFVVLPWARSELCAISSDQNEVIICFRFSLQTWKFCCWTSRDLLCCTHVWVMHFCLQGCGRKEERSQLPTTFRHRGAVFDERALKVNSAHVKWIMSFALQPVLSSCVLSLCVIKLYYKPTFLCGSRSFCDSLRIFVTELVQRRR